MHSRISEIVTHGREADVHSPSLSSSTSRPPRPSSSQTVSSPKAVDGNSLPTSQSATKPSHLSLSTQSIASHRRNNSTTVIWPPKSSISPASDTSSTRRPSSSPSPSLQSLPTPLLPHPASYLTHQPGATGIDTRNPPIKRQPASRSSHGIETSTGPPPALITQRSYTAESAWKHPPSADSAAARPHQIYRSTTQNSIDSVIHLAQLAPDEPPSVNSAKVTGRVSRQEKELGNNMTTTSASSKQPQSLDDDQDPTLRNLMRPASSHAATTVAETNDPAQNQRHGQSKGSQEDLFLTLARSNSLAEDTTGPSTRSERRRVSVSVISRCANDHLCRGAMSRSASELMRFEMCRTYLFISVDVFHQLVLFLCGDAEFF